MWFSSWMRNRKRSHSGQPSSTQRSSPGQRATFRPRLEALEDRWLPSTLTVLNNLDSGPGSLRAEIAAAHSGDTIVFAKSVHAITLTSGELSIGVNLDIEGPGAATLTVSGDNASRVFDVQGDVTVTIGGLTIANGLVVDGKGGGIANEEGATLHLVNDTFAGNISGAQGNLILSSGHETLTGTNTYSGSTTINGGTLQVEMQQVRSILYITPQFTIHHSTPRPNIWYRFWHRALFGWRWERA